MKLNVGCGEFYAEGWANLDLPTCPHHKDLTWDVTRGLPADLPPLTHVYMGHVLEHLWPNDAVRLLQDAARVRAPGGRVLVVGPDLSRAHLGNEAEMRDGGHRWPGDEHRWAPTARGTLRLCQEVFAAHEIPIDDVGDEWPLVSRAPWQCAVVCA